MPASSRRTSSSVLLTEADAQTLQTAHLAVWSVTLGAEARGSTYRAERWSWFVSRSDESIVGRVAQNALATNAATSPEKPDSSIARSIVRRSFAALRVARSRSLFLV